MEWIKTIDAVRGDAGAWKLLLLFLVLPAVILSPPLLSRAETDEQGRFFVTGHILNKQVDVGVVDGFLEKAVPFINSTDPDFVVFTGDVVLGGIDGFHRLPVETIEKQYRFLVDQVIGRIGARVYCVAGNHDTGSVPHAPSIELFETLLNPLHFSFEHKGSLFLFLSMYEPFHHIPQNNNIAPFEAIWEDYDTPASRAFLDSLRQEVSGSYDHIFVFMQASPCGDTPIGYYWTNFLMPLFSSLGKDVHVFSTEHLARMSLYYQVNSVVQCGNVRFYNFAVFPRGSYMARFDKNTVSVDLREGDDFVPATLQEVDCQPATRLSMLRRYLIINLGYPIRGRYNRLINKLRNFAQ